MNHSASRTTSILRPTHARGMTLIEISVVCVVIMAFAGLLFTSSRAWKADSDRSTCIMNQSRVQKAMRGHAYMYGYDIGSTIYNLPSKLIGPGRYIDSTPTCATNGTYTFGAEHGQNTVPPIGVIYMSCSLSESEGHEPSSFGDW